MIIEPYKATPPHTFMAVLLDSETILHEDGSEYPLEETPKNTRVWASWDHRVEQIWKKERIGFVYTNEANPIRWRKTLNPNDPDWKNVHDSRNVFLSRANAFPQNNEEALHSLMDWRDWIEQYGANARGSIASVSKSIFKATLDKPFISPKECPKAIKHPIGGRLIPCREEWSAYVGDFIQWDMQAAYAKKLGSMKFGGTHSKWTPFRKTGNFREWGEKGIPVFVVARVWIPKMDLGPLPTRRTKYAPFSYFPVKYHTNKEVYGTWTLQEILNAEAVGCTVNIDRVWVHVGAEFSFAKWWNAIEDGRSTLNGFSKYLAKATGNALWGQFSLRPTRRKIKFHNEENRIQRRIISGNGIGNRTQSPELADHLSGQIRAELYRFALNAGPILLQGNTDGAWIEETEGFRPPSDEWLPKKRARYMEFIDASNYRYWEPEKEEPKYVMAGCPFDVQERSFNSTWRKHSNVIPD